MVKMETVSDTPKADQRSFRRRVFYIPGYDPIHPRRYRELYRKEGQAQAAISGYGLSLKPKKVKAKKRGRPRKPAPAPSPAPAPEPVRLPRWTADERDAS